MVSQLQTYRRYQFMPWRVLKPQIIWKQGQHVLTVGGTGTGKSTVAGQFLNLRAQVAVCVSKGMDPIFEQLPYSEYERIKTWNPGRKTKVLVWPEAKRTLAETRKHKHDVFIEMFDDILLRRGNWCIDVDEEHYMSSTLGLRDEITDILEQGRSAGISMWNNTQRPSDIPLATYVNSSHAFLFQSQERYDADRLGRMVNKHSNAKEMMYNLDLLDSMETHEFVYLDKTGKLPPVRSIIVKEKQKNGSNKR